MRTRGWPALLLALGCSAPWASPSPAAAPSVTSKPVSQGPTIPLPVVSPVSPVSTPVAKPPAPVVAPEPLPQQPAVPAGGHAVAVQILRGPMTDDGGGGWTRFALALVDVTGNESAAATSGRLDAPCSEVPAEPGDLARWVCWWAGGGWNVRLVQDRRGAVLRAQGTDEGLHKPAPWEDQMIMAVPASAGLVVHRRADLEVASEAAALPIAAAAGAAPVDVQVRLVRPRGQPRTTQVTLRVQDGERVHAVVTSPWLAGTPGRPAAADSEALVSWSLGAADEGALRVIQSGDRVVLQQRSAASAAAWEDVVLVSLPFGRAAKVTVKKGA